jgi:transaldolase
LLAHDTASTLAEAKRLWKLVARPNLMIKIPATRAGLPAIQGAIADGINVNVTLIFSLQRYGEVMEAYISGLEERAAKGSPIHSIASVASFFVSRVDSIVDGQLGKAVSAGRIQAEAADRLSGKAAVANARIAYADFKECFGSARFEALRVKGARVQRPLWASTSTKNPKYRDVIYVEELVGPHTVNTVPPQTLLAFLDHGKVTPGSLGFDVPAAREALKSLESVGVSYQAVTQQLEDDGVKAFADAYTDLLETIERRRKQYAG